MEALPASERLSPKVTIWLTWPGEIVATRATLQDVEKAAATKRPVLKRIVTSFYWLRSGALSMAQSVLDSQVEGLHCLPLVAGTPHPGKSVSKSSKQVG